MKISLVMGLVLLLPTLVFSEPNAKDSFSESQINEIEVLAQSPSWLNLGHYHKSIFGKYYSIIQSNDFFLSKDGAQNPKSELEETLRQMRDPQTRKVQCRYVARRDLLKRQKLLFSEDLIKCPDWEDWIRKVNPESLTLVFVSANVESTNSIFGHLLLKVNGGGRAKETKSLLFTYKGLKEYPNLDKKNIWEYKLSLGRIEIERLFMHLREVENANFKSNFFSNNDSYMFLKAFEIADPFLNLTNALRPWTIPSDALRKVMSSHELVIESPQVGFDRPDNSHDSALVSVGLGRIENNDSSFYLRLRPALQGWSELDWGLARGSELEILNFEGEQKSSEGMKLKKMDLLKVRIFKPVDFFKRPVSWGFATGWEKSFYAEAMMGPSANFFDMLTWSESIFFRLQQVQDERFGVGLQSEFSFKPLERLSLSARHRWISRTFIPTQEFLLELSVRLNRNQDLSFRDQQEKVGSNPINHSQFVFFRQYF